jgi:chromosome segregation ATPase
LQAKEVTINRLENGEVQADRVIIEHAMGGTVRAKEIIIKSLYGHTRLFASCAIEIETLKGEENKISIDPQSALGEDGEIETMLSHIESLTHTLQANERKIKTNIASIHKSNDAIQAAKQHINLCKRKGKKPPQILIQKIKQFSTLVTKTKETKEAYDKTHKELAHLKKRLENFSNMTSDAKITNLSHWSGHNIVRFVLLNPKREFTHIPKGSARTLRLIKNDDGIYTIQATA